MKVSGEVAKSKSTRYMVYIELIKINQIMSVEISNSHLLAWSLWFDQQLDVQASCSRNSVQPHSSTGLGLTSWLL